MRAFTHPEYPGLLPATHDPSQFLLGLWKLKLDPNTKLLICRGAGIHLVTVPSGQETHLLGYQAAERVRGRGRVRVVVTARLRHVHAGSL